MVLPIGGFMPIPLAMMIPFMATQSMVMGEAFGKGFQYGKRRISAMDNPTFNAYSVEQMVSEMFETYNKITPEIKQALSDSKDLQNHIVDELIKIIPNAIANIFGFNQETGQVESVPRPEQTGGRPPPKAAPSGIDTSIPLPTKPETPTKRPTKTPKKLDAVHLELHKNIDRLEAKVTDFKQAILKESKPHVKAILEKQLKTWLWSLFTSRKFHHAHYGYWY